DRTQELRHVCRGWRRRAASAGLDTAKGVRCAAGAVVVSRELGGGVWSRKAGTPRRPEEGPEEGARGLAIHRRDRVAQHRRRDPRRGRRDHGTPELFRLVLRGGRGRLSCPRLLHPWWLDDRDGHLD